MYTVCAIRNKKRNSNINLMIQITRSRIVGHVVVNRCSGSCFPSSQECLPLETTNMTIRVMAVRSTFTSGGSWENVCAEIVVEKHVR